MCNPCSKGNIINSYFIIVNINRLYISGTVEGFTCYLIKLQFHASFVDRIKAAKSIAHVYHIFKLRCCSCMIIIESMALALPLSLKALWRNSSSELGADRIDTDRLDHVASMYLHVPPCIISVISYHDFVLQSQYLAAFRILSVLRFGPRLTQPSIIWNFTISIIIKQAEERVCFLNGRTAC